MEPQTNRIVNETFVDSIVLLKSAIQLIKDLDIRMKNIEEAVKTLQQTLDERRQDDGKQEVMWCLFLSGVLGGI